MSTKQGHTNTDLESRAHALLAWARANSRYLTIAGIVAVVAVASVWFARTSARNKELAAGRALAEAQQAVATNNLALAQSDLQRLIQRYDGTKAASQARLQLAQVYFGQQKVDSGIAILRQAGPPGEPFNAPHYALLAVGLEQAGKPAEAAAEYIRAADASQSKLERATFQADAARAYEAAGNKDEAAKIWGALAADETNPIAGEAKVRLGELTVKPISNG